MSALAWFVVAAEGVITLIAVGIAWHASPPVSPRARARARVPAIEAAPEHPRYGPLLATPAGGITVVRGDGAISVKADRHVQRKATRDHAPTGPFAAVPYAPEPPSWAQPPPTAEELRADFARWQQDRDAYQASYREERRITAPQVIA